MAEPDTYFQNPDDRPASVDVDKLVNILRRTLPWVLLLFILFLTIAYTYLRYTKPVYESKSILKLDIKNEVPLLGINTSDEDQNIKTISSEIELLRSNLFFNKVIRELNLDVTVYTMGNVLVDERYKNPPFNVEYHIKNEQVMDIPIYVEILNPREYQLNFTYAGQEIRGKFHFGDWVDDPAIRLRLTPTPYYTPDYKDVNLYFVINSERALVNYLSSNLNVQPLNLNANTIEISFRDHNQYKARDLVDAIDTIYLNYTREEKNKANTQKIGFIDEQLKSTEDRLVEFESYFENFTINNKATDLGNNLNRSIAMLNTIDSQRYRLREKLTRLQEIHDSISSGKEIGFSLNDQQLLPSFLQKDISDMNDLIRQRYVLSQSYNTNTQAFRKLNSQVEFLDGNLKKSLEEYIVLINRQFTMLDRQQKVSQQELMTIPSKTTEYSKIQRYYKLYEDFYLSLMQKRAEFQLALAGTVTDFKILSPANLPYSPLVPEPWMIYAISLVGWFVTAFFLIGFMYLFNNKLNSQEELERKTRLPVLGSIPFYKEVKLKESRLIIGKDSHNLISESFRTLRTNLQFLKMDKGHVRISISSNISGEGKSFVSINLGAVLALSGKKVILVDLDMRRPNIHRIFKGANVRGVSTVISGQDKIEECIQLTQLENYHYLVAGPNPPNPSELILSEEFDRLLEFLSTRYDVVLLDTPPIGVVTDGVLVMKKADIPIFIFRAGFSDKRFLENLEKLNLIHAFKNLALILNAVKSTRGANYGSAYGNGYYLDKRSKGWFSRL